MNNSGKNPAKVHANETGATSNHADPKLTRSVFPDYECRGRSTDGVAVGRRHGVSETRHTRWVRAVPATVLETFNSAIVSLIAAAIAYVVLDFMLGLRMSAYAVSQISIAAITVSGILMALLAAILGQEVVAGHQAADVSRLRAIDIASDLQERLGTFIGRLGFETLGASKAMAEIQRIRATLEAGGKVDDIDSPNRYLAAMLEEARAGHSAVTAELQPLVATLQRHAIADSVNLAENQRVANLYASRQRLLELTQTAISELGGMRHLISARVNSVRFEIETRTHSGRRIDRALFGLRAVRGLGATLAFAFVVAIAASTESPTGLTFLNIPVVVALGAFLLLQTFAAIRAVMPD